MLVDNLTQGEKTLLLELILFDLRADWTYPNERVALARELVNDLGYQETGLLLDKFMDRRYECTGKIFRDNDFGYEWLYYQHEETRTLEDKSEQFKDLYWMALSYPEHSGMEH